MDEKRMKGRWLLVIFAAAIGLVLLVSILGATVFKPRQPVITVNSMELIDLDVSLNPKLRLNLSLVISISVKNPNRVSLKYSAGSAFLEYKGQVVGQAPFPAGRISAGQTLSMVLTLNVMADRLLSNLQALVEEGLLPLSTMTRISGKANVLFVTVHVVAYSSCHVSISISSQSISNSDCTFNTRIS